VARTLVLHARLFQVPEAEIAGRVLETQATPFGLEVSRAHCPVPAVGVRHAALSLAWRLVHRPRIV